jgi:hypothetical protein
VAEMHRHLPNPIPKPTSASACTAPEAAILLTATTRRSG